MTSVVTVVNDIYVIDHFTFTWAVSISIVLKHLPPFPSVLSIPLCHSYIMSPTPLNMLNGIAIFVLSAFNPSSNISLSIFIGTGWFLQLLGGSDRSR